MTRRPGERGIALIAALWALLLLSAIGTTVTLVARERVWLAGGHDQRVAARWAAEAGIAASEARLAAWAGGLAAMPEARSFGGASPLDSAAMDQRRVWIVALNSLDSLLAGRGEDSLPNGARYRVAVRDATALLNLNAAGEPELRDFFARWVRDERKLSVLVHSLLDWRDEDDLVRGQGAEAEHYARLPTPYPIRNGPLLSVRELLVVNGMTPELFAEVEPYVAVLPSRELRINVNAAPAEVLAAVPGFTPVLAERLVSRRRLAGPIATAAEITSDPGLAALFDRAEGALAVNVMALYPEVVEIEALGQGGDSGPAHRVAATYALRGGTLERLERREAGS